MSSPPAEKQKIVLIMGPTGSGKTAAALGLAGLLPVEIINADSMQFYRYMDIGTSKPTPEEQQAAPHHLFSVINPDEQFTAAHFMERGRAVIAEVLSRGSIPLIVGGTGLYIRALTRGLCPAPRADESLRRDLRSQGREVLYERLQAADPDAAARISPHGMVRFVRALEVFYLSGGPLSRSQGAHGFRDEPYDCLKICLSRDRQELYGRIEERVDLMVAQGFEDEVRRLLAMGFSGSLKSMGSIGYKQMTSYVLGGLPLEEAVYEIKRETRRFAKRQLTWFRREEGLRWIMLPGGEGALAAAVKNFLNIR